MFELFVVLVLAHLIADFFIKTDWFISNEKKLRRFLIHGIIYFLVSMIIVLSVGMLKQSIIAIIVISVARMLVEYIKDSFFLNENVKLSIIEYMNKISPIPRAMLLVVGQSMHGLIIYFSVYYLANGINIISHKDHMKKLYVFIFENGVISSDEAKVFCFIIVIVISSKVASNFISLITEDLIRSREAGVKSQIEDMEKEGALSGIEGAKKRVIGARSEIEEGKAQSASAAESLGSNGHTRSLLIPPFPNYSSEGPLIKSDTNAEQYIKSELQAFHQFTKNEYKDFHIERTLEITEKDLKNGTEVKNKISYNTSQFNDSSPLIASYIGIIERFLITVLVVKGAYTGIAFLGALKAMARYKQFDEKSYAEKFLLGTLLSALTGLICGLIIMRIFNIHII